VELDYPLKRARCAWRAPRSTITRAKVPCCATRPGVIAFPKRGPRPELSDDELSALIRRVIQESPFSGEGHRKVTARLWR